MRIGIDIDDTMTDISEKLKLAALEYARYLGKSIVYSGEDFVDAKNDGSIYQKKFGFNEDELKYFLKDIQEGVTDNVFPRENCVEIIDKLKNEGHEIIVVTARSFEFHDDPFGKSKKWLEKHNIKYDKLIVNAIDKGLVCKNEAIDLLIDDNINNCLSAANENIKVIVFSKNKIDNMICTNNWLEVYEIIKDFKN